MRVSELFNLGQEQPTLEFVDVDVNGDMPIFVDPRAFKAIGSPWASKCISLLQDFFQTVLSAIQTGDTTQAKLLLSSLGEPNETHLGLSRGAAKGRGMGAHLANDVWRALSGSRAISSGLLEDLEDTVLFIDGIGFDIVSDITTNIVRDPLIEFTQDVARYYGIPLTPDVPSGRLWCPRRHSWNQIYVELPITNSGRLLLVPKSVVRKKQTFNSGEYLNQYILPFLVEQELGKPMSSLVETLKNGNRRVTKKSIIGQFGSGKQLSLSTTIQEPSILAKYRAEHNRPTPPTPEEVAILTNTDAPLWDDLLERVRSTPTGTADATNYHRAVQALLTAIFFPALDFPEREFEIHQGRKRIDITYTNQATSGFFHWVNHIANTSAPYIFVECKNYGTELSNPEIDQLSGRFSNIRGWVGLLVYRGFGDKARLLERCRDTAKDNRGFILALDDGDLESLVDDRKNNLLRPLDFPLLRTRYTGLAR